MESDNEEEIPHPLPEEDPHFDHEYDPPIGIPADKMSSIVLLLPGIFNAIGNPQLVMRTRRGLNAVAHRIGEWFVANNLINHDGTYQDGAGRAQQNDDDHEWHKSN